METVGSSDTHPSSRVPVAREVYENRRIGSRPPAGTFGFDRGARSLFVVVERTPPVNPEFAYSKVAPPLRAWIYADLLRRTTCT